MTTSHFIDNDWVVHTACLDTLHFPGGQTVEKIADKLREVTALFAAPDEKISAWVHDQAANEELAGKTLEAECGWATVTCSADCPQNALKSTLQEYGCTLEKLLVKVRKIVGHFKHNTLATYALLSKQCKMSPTNDEAKETCTG